MSMSLPLPLPAGFRFNPTDEELIFYYLRNRAASQQCPAPIIADVDVYKFDPWDLPSQALYGDREWYFFSPRDRKYPNGTRPNRAAGSGYWKSTGTDKPIHDGAVGKGVGVKKALIFYQGRPPKGTKTGWVMHEYRIAPDPLEAALNAYKPLHSLNVSMRLDDWVLCRIYNKMDQLASPIVPLQTLAGYDDHDDLSGGRMHTHSVNSTGSLPTLSSMSEVFDEYPVAQTFDTEPEHLAVHPSLNHLFSGGGMQTGSANAVGSLPTISAISDIFDEYPVVQTFDSEPEHLAVHPSLNHLFSGGDSTHVEPSYYALPSSSLADSGGAGKRKATSTEECGGDEVGMGSPFPSH